jgi:hypothetical protein
VVLLFAFGFAASLVVGPDRPDEPLTTTQIAILYPPLLAIGGVWITRVLKRSVTTRTEGVALRRVWHRQRTIAWEQVEAFDVLRHVNDEGPDSFSARVVLRSGKALRLPLGHGYGSARLLRDHVRELNRERKRARTSVRNRRGDWS